MLVVRGVVKDIIYRNYGSKSRGILILGIGKYLGVQSNNELGIFFNEDRLHLLNEFSAKDYVVVTCQTLFFTNDNQRFYNYIIGVYIKFDVLQYPYFSKKFSDERINEMLSKVDVPEGLDYREMIKDGWTNMGLIEAGYVTRKKKDLKT